MQRKAEWILTIIVMFAVLAGVDRWVDKNFAGPPPFASYYRFSEEVKPSEFARQLASIEKAKGIRVAFIGDSVIRGATVPTGDETIPAYLQKAINRDLDLRSKGIKVFNFGIAGAREADKYAVLKTLLDHHAVDVVIMNVTYPFFSDEILKIPVQFPGIYLDAFTPREKKELGIQGVIAQKSGQPSPDTNTPAQNADNPGQAPPVPTGFEGALTRFISDHWELYKYRQDVNLYLFGGHPVQVAKKELERALGKELAAKETGENVTADGEKLPPGTKLAAKDRPENLYKPYDRFPWEQPEVLHLQKVFDVKTINGSNLGYKYLEKTISLTQENHLPAFFFLTPVNEKLLDRYHALDKEKWQANSRLLEKAFAGSHAACYDFQQAVDARYFHDSLHLLDQGNELVAKDLFVKIKPQLLQISRGKAK